MRGGVLYIGKRYCKANNEFVDGYDESMVKSFIMYFDANNLYGWAMTQCLSYGGFKWLSEEEVNEVNFDLVDSESSVGYILKVNLEYPDKLHELHNDYPLAAEKLVVSDDMLSKYCFEIAKKYEIRVGDVAKLIPNLKDKEKYVVHFKNLQLYKSLGMKVKRNYRVLQFNQSDWLKKFFMWNTEKRMYAANDFEKDFFQLMINCVYGKAMENLRKRVHFKLVNNVNDYVK